MSLIIGKNVKIGRGAGTSKSINFGKFGIASATATDPLSIITSKSSIFFVSADIGTTISTGVSAWADQSGNSNSFTQATTASQPTLITADVDFGGRNSLLGDGVNDFMTNVWVPLAPTTNPQWFFVVFNQVTWTAGKYLFAGSVSSAICSFLQFTSTPAMSMGNTTVTNNNAGAAIGTSVRGEVSFTGSTSDYLKLGSTTVTGTSAAVSAGLVGLKLFTRNNGTAAQTINAKVACIGCWNGAPTSGEKAALDAWVTNYYGPGVVV